MKIIKYLKYAFSVFFLFMFFLIVDINQLILTLSQINLVLYFLVFLLFLCIKLISTLRWKILLVEVKVVASFLTLYLLNTFSVILNFVLPSNVGGDVYKGYAILKKTKTKLSNVVYSTFLDRVFDFCILICFVIIFSLFVIDSNLGIMYFVLSLILGALLLGIMFSNRIAKLMIFISPIKKGKLIDFIRAFEKFNLSKKSLLFALILSVGFQLLGLFNQYLIFYSLGLSIPILVVFFAVALTRIITVIPITIGGIGLREISLLSVLSLYGVTAEQVLSYTLIQYSFVLLLGLLYFVYTLVFGKKIYS